MPETPRARLSRPPLERMMKIHDELRRSALVNCTRLADTLEVSRKTIVRDIAFMRDRLELPIEFDPRINAYRYTHPVNAFPTVHVTEGELMALLGPSGSGKTTLLRIIAGLEWPETGDVRFDGQSAVTRGVRERRVGFVFQHYALFRHMTVFDNVAFPMREHTDFSEAVIRDLVLLKLHAVGLRNAAHLMPSEISGGMARRVALARAVALDPQLMMYDEPFAGLDPISMGVTANLIRQLNDALGSTSVLVSHDVHESFAIADYVYFLSQGKIVAHGTPEQMMASEDPYVRQFVHAEPDGPVPFHYPGSSLAQDLGLKEPA